MGGRATGLPACPVENQGGTSNIFFFFPFPSTTYRHPSQIRPHRHAKSSSWQPLLRSPLTAPTRRSPPDPAPPRVSPSPALTPSNMAWTPPPSSSPAKTPPTTRPSPPTTMASSAPNPPRKSSTSIPCSAPIGRSVAYKASRPISSTPSSPNLRARPSPPRSSPIPPPLNSSPASSARSPLSNAPGTAPMPSSAALAGRPRSPPANPWRTTSITSMPLQPPNWLRSVNPPPLPFPPPHLPLLRSRIARQPAKRPAGRLTLLADSMETPLATRPNRLCWWDAAHRPDHRRKRPERRRGNSGGPENLPPVRRLRRSRDHPAHGTEHGARVARGGDAARAGAGTTRRRAGRYPARGRQDRRPRLGGDAVLGRVVGGGVRTHPVGECLDQHRSLPAAGGVQRSFGHGIHGEHVVAVHPDPGEAEAAGPLVEGDPGLALDRLGDGPLVVLAEEDDGRVHGRRVHEGLVHVALGARTITEVGDDGRVPIKVACADGVVVLDTHRVTHCMQRLSADDDRVEMEVVLVRVPSAMVDPAEHPQQVEGVDPATPGNAVLAVRREGVVLRTKRTTGADLCCLLAEQACPQAELTLALQGRGLGVEPADEDLVAIEAAQVIVGEISDVWRVFGMLDALTLRGAQLDERGSP